MTTLNRFSLGLCFALSMCLPLSAQRADYDTQRGFVHPGGLHTQQDFDRVKQQLAEGNEKVTAAHNVLKKAAYAQPTVTTYPVETIVRGGGSGENYINAARGAAMAYQNALRWKIEDNTACGDAAVRILMAWARTTKAISGNSDQCLAVGLYGYEFAQAAELMRDYEGWSRADFDEFKQWMLTLWYPKAIHFLRSRNGTWENSGKWWQAPGHYWSNWGLCNTLCVASIGILCDDVFIYNQAMSYFKYDQVGTYKDPRTDNPIRNDGLTEFLGNLVVTTSPSELETGAYGVLGQMNESGRDTGHSAMALGLAVDLAKIGWNQGDDLFAYMDHRLAAGIEYVAAQTQSVQGLPWTDYAYGTSGIYYTDSRTWVMTEPALGAQMRPYWGTVIGVYEGIKGVQMPFSGVAYDAMGIDAGGQGSTSGGYDHLGYSVLMNTYNDRLCPSDKVPTELKPLMEYSGTITNSLIPNLNVEQTLGNISGKIIAHNELGGLVNTFTTNNKTGVPQGQTLKLMPQLPEGEEDTGLWSWNTGASTRDITVTTERSQIYRVTYTNSHGVKSQLSFSIAVQGDCTPTELKPVVTYNNVTTNDTVIKVLYGKTCNLSVTPSDGYGTFRWSTGSAAQTITTTAVRQEKEYTVTYTNQGGAVTIRTFRVVPCPAEPYIQTGSTTLNATEAIVSKGGGATLGLTVPSVVSASSVVWSTGDKGTTLTLENIQTSGTYTATFTLNNEEITIAFDILVKSGSNISLSPGNYLIVENNTGRLLSGHGNNQPVQFEYADLQTPADGQIWYVDNIGTRHKIVSLPDSLGLYSDATLGNALLNIFFVEQAEGTNRIAIRTGSSSTNAKYWTVTASGTIDNSNNALTSFPFVLLPYSTDTGIETVGMSAPYDSQHNAVYDIAGRSLSPHHLLKGIYIIGGRKVIIR